MRRERWIQTTTACSVGRGDDPAYAEIPKAVILDPFVACHCNETVGAGVIVIVHPNCWGQPPAILQGGVDRVIRPVVAHEFMMGDAGDGVPNGLLKAHAAVVTNTSSAPHDREMAVCGDPLATLWRIGILDLCGANTFYGRMCSCVVIGSLAERRA